MGFLTPLFLIGMAAVAVPVVVHLTHRPRSDTVPFPSLMFLQQIPFKSTHRRTLRDWLLFALRGAAIVLLAAAFARPFLGTPAQAVAEAAGARARVVLLDRSYSMGYGDRWERAREAARRSLAELQPQDRAALVLFDRVPESSGEPTADRPRLLALLDSARPSAGVSRYAPALRMAQEMLESSGLARREIVLVSDFQKTGWEGGDDVSLPSSTTLTWVDLSDGDPSNLAITGVDLARDYEAGRERVIPAARLVNKGEKAATDVEVTFEVDGRPVRQRRATLAPNTSTTVAFDPFPLPPAAAPAAVRLGGDLLPQDDAFHFMLTPGGLLPVLILEGGRARERSLYLRRALAIGHRPRFRVETRTGGQVGPDDAALRPVVILNDVAPAGPGSARRLREMVEAGGGLLVVLGEQSTPAAWRGEAEGLLPGPFAPAVDRSADWGATLAHVDYGHRLFEAFRGPHSGDFSTARFFRYRPLEVQAGVLARFDDGAVALAEKTVGKGKVLVWTSTADTAWNDLPLQPVFLPFLHRAVQHAAGHLESRAWHTVGEALDLTGEAWLARGEAAVIGPAGEKSRLPAGSRGLELQAPGFYEVRSLEAGGASRTAAVNVDPAEGDLASLDPEELAGAVTQAGSGATAPRAEPALTTEDHESRQALWRYVLLAAFLLLAAETAWSNRLSARRAAAR
ncbi:MAG TPA: BatA domain-containing protein [Vicinamibacteria bacterium]|nr:BatA domain-containing protein [Vicinamibacteria bacterium]